MARFSPPLAILIRGELYGPAHIPQAFARQYRKYLKVEHRTILLAGPVHPDYWKVWDEVLSTVTVIYNGKELFLNIQQGNLVGVR